MTKTATTTTDAKLFIRCSSVILIAALAFVGKTFAADTGADVRAKTVQFEDLKLSSPAGAEVLLHRIRVAASEVCEQPQGRRDLSQKAKEKSCISASVERAVRQIDNAYLTASYEHLNGRMPVRMAANVQK